MQKLRLDTLTNLKKVCIINNTVKDKIGLKREDNFMLAKYWKKIGLFIVIVACLFNIVTKLVSKIPYLDQLTQTAQYVSEQEEKGKK